MSAICQNTTLDYPIQNVLTYEAYNHVLEMTNNGRKRPQCRGGIVNSIAYDFLALNEIIDLPNNPSSFTQNLIPYYNEFQLSDIPSHVYDEWRDIHAKGGILAAAKMTVMSHKLRDYMYFKSLIDSVISHIHYETLIKMYYWRWILEQLVVATARPKIVTMKYR